MTRRPQSGRMALFAVLVSGAFLACQSSLTEVTEAVGPRSFDFAVGPAGSVLPGGAAYRELVRTLVQRHQVTYEGVLVTSDPVVLLASTHTQDTTATDSATTVMVGSLRHLSGNGVYQVWAQAPDGTISPVVGRVTEYTHVFDQLDPITGDSVFVADSSDVAASGGGTYAGSDDPLVDSVAFRIIPADPGNTVNPFVNTQVNAVLVTIESAQATTPSNVRFAWRRLGIATGGSTSSDAVLRADTVLLATFTVGSVRTDSIEVTRYARRRLTGTGALTFGNYGGLDIVNAASPNDYIFAPRGAGLAGARGPEMSVDMEELARPPVGFYYAGYIVDADGKGVLVDTLRSAWSADPTVSRVSMYDADVNDLLPDIVAGEIRHSQIRNCAAGSGQNSCQNTMALPADNTFTGYVNFQLKLEPKGGVALGPNKSVTHLGPLPKAVK